MIPLDFHRLAAEELSAVDERYAKQDQDLADRFLRTMRATLELIRADPMWHAVEVGDIRRRRVPGFPYRIVFEYKEATGVFVVAVMHDRRRPRYWRGRS